VRAKGQVTLPDEIRKAARLDEGDLLEAELTEEGILLRPQRVIDPSQAWFWTAEWQAEEREADAQEAAGLGQTFDSGETFLEALRAQVKPSERRRKH
jgi:AbrB family looped-hinge helix DNA binding protein